MKREELEMTNSGFIVSSLPSYVANNRDVILKNFGLVGTGTRPRISLQTGVKTSAYLNYLNIAPTLQSGTGCGFSAAGEITLTQKTVSAALIKVDMDICPKTLLGKWAEYLVRINANDQDLPFEQYIIDGTLREINKKIEKLIWQGDTSQTTNPDIKWIDGFIVQMDADASVIDVAIASGTSAYNSIKAVYLGMTSVAVEKGGAIFVGYELWSKFLQDLVEKNYFHYAGPIEAAPEEVYFPGTNVRVIHAPGLDGVTNKIVGTFADNLVYATDFENDSEDFDLWYSKDDRVFKIHAEWTSGAAYYFGDHVTLGTIS